MVSRARVERAGGLVPTDGVLVEKTVLRCPARSCLLWIDLSLTINLKDQLNSPPLTRITTSSLAGSPPLSTKVKKRCLVPMSTYPVYALQKAARASEFQLAQGQEWRDSRTSGWFHKT